MSRLEQERLERRVEQRLESAQSRTAGIGDEPLRWLALLPEWTDRLARFCRFPYGEASGLRDVLDRMEGARLCEVRRERDVAGREQTRFWMPSDVRVSLFEREPGLREGLTGDARTIAARIFSSPQVDPDEVATGAVRWAQLVTVELTSNVATGRALTELARRALGEGDTAQAEEWIATGAALGDLLGGELKLAVERARRQLRLHYRTVQDADYLSRFVERREQVDEIRKLLGPSPEWAVHFIGQSGVGKTMLMRHLTSSGPGSDPFMCAARIDFDYLDPRFPLESPARLLGELAEDLAVNVTNATQEARLLAFSEAVTRCENQKPEALEHDVLTALRTDRFKQVVDAFAAFVETLPPPVVLVLDTCEELAKLRPPGEEVPSIRATFEILEQVHRAAEEVRVVFAGRRWLTRKAANEVRGLATPPAVMGMEPREFMWMHAVRGFTRAEVVEYLLEVRRLELDPEMIATILASTEDRGKPASMDDAEGPSEEPRYSPSDVALFANWIAREPGLEPSDLASGNLDPYVEVRIFQRITSPEVLAAIPAALLLERFDGAMIAPALGRRPGAQGRVLKELIEHEWTHLEGGPDPEDIVLSIDRGLLRRLRDYFDRTDDRQRQLETTRAALEPGLARLLERPPGEVRPDLVDSALKALPPQRAARLLDDLADRVAATGAWAWAESVCDLLLSPEREPALAPSLTASAGALYLAALRHRSAGGDLVRLWETVIETAHLHPDPGAHKVLETRGRLGLLASAAAGGGVRTARAQVTLTRGRLLLGSSAAAAVAPALLAAAEALIDSRELGGRPIPVDNLSACLNRLVRHFDGSEIVQAQLFALLGRMWALHGEWARARLAFSRVERLSLDAAPPDTADWVPPGSLRHRILLELLRFRLADHDETKRLLKRCEKTALEHFGGVDAAQLLSLVLQSRLARGDLSPQAIGVAESYEGVTAGYAATAPAHRAAPPLFVSVAECWLGAGRPERALELLLEREQAAAARRTDEDSTRAAGLATVRVLRRQRLRERFGLLAGLSSGPDPEVRAEAMAAGALIAGLRPPRGRASAGDHAAWRARILLDPRGEEEALGLVREAAPDADDDPCWALHLALDRLEAELVGGRWTPRRRRQRRIAAAGREVRWRVGKWDHARSIATPLEEELTRLWLRYSALMAEPWPALFPQVTAWRRRLCGRLALEEGELLALRLPERSISLLEMAVSWFDDAADAAGAFTATLRCAIAEVHAGLDTAARERRQDIVARYEDLRAADPRLPSLAQVVDRELKGRGTAGDSPWRGWTHRLGAYLRWCEGDVPAGAALDVDPETALVPAAGMEGSSISLGVRDRWEPVRNFAIPILVLLVAASVAALVSGNWSYGAIVFVSGMVGFGAGAIGIAGAELLAPRLSGVLPIEAFDLSLVVSGTRPDGAQLVEARLQPWSRDRLMRLMLALVRSLPLRSRWGATFALDADTAGKAPPRSLAVAAASRARGRAVPIRLSVAANLAPFAWERWLFGNRAWEEGLEGLPDVWRVRSLDLMALPEGLWPQRLALLCAALWRPFVESSAVDGTTWGPEDGMASKARATIALGTPLLTRAGWRLRLDDDLPSPGLEERASRPRQLLSPDRLAKQAPIAVVIGRPGSELMPDGAVGNDLRAFANEAFLAGARAVITVPPLPVEQASEAISVLTGELCTWTSPPDGKQLRRLASRVRNVVCAAETGTEGPLRGEQARRTRAELALDVCLFGPPETEPN